MTADPMTHPSPEAVAKAMDYAVVVARDMKRRAARGTHPDMPSETCIDTLAAHVATLTAKLEAERAKLKNVEAERDEAVNWSHIVDTCPMDDFDRVGEQWIALNSIQRMFRALASVFQKTAGPGIMDRFNSSMNAIAHQAFVEGCLVGVKSERARQIITTPQNDDSALATRLAAAHPAPMQEGTP